MCHVKYCFLFFSPYIVYFFFIFREVGKSIILEVYWFPSPLVLFLVFSSYCPLYHFISFLSPFIYRQPTRQPSSRPTHEPSRQPTGIISSSLFHSQFYHVSCSIISTIMHCTYLHYLFFTSILPLPSFDNGSSFPCYSFFLNSTTFPTTNFTSVARTHTSTHASTDQGTDTTTNTSTYTSTYATSDS